jgi:multimeric flavodoxin WrbA
MNAIIILGSRNPQGQTAQAAAALAEGLSAKACQVKQIILPAAKVERCRQCDAAGWGACRTEGKCVIDDDFAGIVQELRAADLAVFANPVYFGDLSESLRAFLDRLRRICRHDAGKERIAGKPAIGICVAGGGGGGAPNCAWSMEKALATTGFDVIDVIPARRQNLPMKLAALRVTGEWLAKA